jgi:diguanylate cyclase (GGDEF)-like protein
MNANNTKKIVPIALMVAGLCVIFVESDAARAFGGALVGAGLALLLRLLYGAFQKGGLAPRAEPTPHKADTLPSLKSPAPADKDGATMQGQKLGTEYRAKQWQLAEAAVDDMLDKFLTLVAAHLPYCTIAVFFPANDGCYAIRRYLSKSARVNGSATIVPSRGLLGSLLARGLQPFHEPGFTNNNATLHYYDGSHNFAPEENIRSILLSPIVAGDDTRGILLADSTKANAYTKDDLAFLTNTAKLLGQAVYYAYMSTEHSLDYQRLAAISNIEKDFWKYLDLDTVMDKMCETISNAVPCDRLTISLKEEDKMLAKIVRVYGDGDGYFKDLEFPLDDGNNKSLISLAYSTDSGFFRNFNTERYEFRYTGEEPQNGGFGSFMAVPIGVNKRIGMILIESTMNDAFTRFNFGLLARLGTSAGIALEKIFSIRKMDAMATHDGLTGLFNRSHFQKVLTSKIAAGKRSGRPISLVICDIDFFKKLNDNYGHQFGDAVLKSIAAKLESCVRLGIDAVARFGGEEFVMIIDQSDRNTAKESVDRIRGEIEAMTFKTSEGLEVKSTMSFGIAEYPLQARDITELISMADKALYAAKKNGRNRVELYWAESSNKFIKDI